MPHFTGVLTFGRRTISAVGYQTQLDYERTVEVESNSRVSVTESVSTSVAESGAFTIIVPDKHAIVGSLMLRIKDPTGATVHQESFSAAALAAGVRIRLLPPEPFVIRPVGAGEKGPTRGVTG